MSPKRALSFAPEMKKSHAGMIDNYETLKNVATKKVKEVEYLKKYADGLIYMKDLAETKNEEYEAQLWTICHLDPHRWGTGFKNLRIEQRCKAAEEERDRTAERASEQEAHFRVR